MNWIMLPSFERDTKKLPKEVLSKLKTTIHSIENAQGIAGIAGIKKLCGYANTFRIRIGNYRLGLKIEMKRQP